MLIFCILQTFLALNYILNASCRDGNILFINKKTFFKNIAKIRYPNPKICNSLKFQESAIRDFFYQGAPNTWSVSLYVKL